MQDISMNILDLVYNSIRAKASFISITIEESDKNNCINIRIEDNGCGMSEKMVEQVVDPFFTTRTTRKIGLGVPLFKEEVEATGGLFSLNSQLGKGTIINGHFVKNHIDTPPLGDLSETITTLIQADGHIHYMFSFTNDSHVFTLDTDEIKKILDGVEINAPEIIVWLKDYIKEGIEA